MTATTGGFYTIKPNEENIQLAIDKSDITTSPLTKSILDVWDKQYKAYLAAQQKQQETKKHTQKVSERDRDNCNVIIYNLNSVNITGKQILDITSKADSFSCTPNSFAEMCNKYMLNETLTKVGQKNCTVGVCNACNEYRNRKVGYYGACDKI